LDLSLVKKDNFKKWIPVKTPKTAFWAFLGSHFFYWSESSSKLLANIKLIILNRPRIVSLSFSRKFDF